ncbi:kinesin-like nuclear fusion protein [Cryomyces antarcticus]|nr:kinesin-like nuclear fusion protein [Cryomyces antarcticus]
MSVEAPNLKDRADVEVQFKHTPIAPADAPRFRDECSRAVPDNDIMEFNENTSMRTTGIRPPSRIPATPGKGLFEITPSDNNARASTMMPPPTTLKHKNAGCRLRGWWMT